MNKVYDLDLNLLKSLHAMIGHEHVGRAAAELGVTQPAMSHALRKLREAFGDPLLVRVGNRMKLSARAEELRPQLDRVFAEVLAMTAPRNFAPESVVGAFRIITHAFVATQHLSDALSRIAKSAPGLSIHLEEFSSDSYAQLEEGGVDLIISAGLQAKPRLVQTLIAEDPLVCLLDSSHPALSDWTPETIFRYPHMALGLLEKRDDPVEVYGRKRGMAPRIVGMSVGNLHMQPALLESSNMIAFLPKSLAEKGARDYALTAIDCAFVLPTIKIRMIWSERHKSDSLHEWVRSMLST